MGANHARTVAASPSAVLSVVVDADESRARSVAETHGVRWATSTRELECDAVIVATPTNTHMAIATALLDAGMPLLVEKPIASDSNDVATLIAASAASQTPMTCGFVERWNPAVRTALDLVNDPILHMMSVRHSPPALRIEADVVVDLMIHDLDLACRLFDGEPEEVGANAYVPSDRNVAEFADSTVRFQGGLANCSVSRVAQRKVRTVTLALPSEMIEIDLIRQDVTVYRHVRHEMRESGTYRADTIMDIPVPRHHGEPLARQFRHFMELINDEVDQDVERATLMKPHTLMAAVLEQAGIA